MKKNRTLLIGLASAILLIVIALAISHTTIPAHTLAAPLPAAAATATPNVSSHLTNLEVEDWLGLAAQTTFEVYHDVPITPTGTYMVLTSTGAVSTNWIVTGYLGQMLILYNISPDAITISDTGYLVTSGDSVLGTGDNLTLISDYLGRWVEVAQADN